MIMAGKAVKIVGGLAAAGVIVSGIWYFLTAPPGPEPDVEVNLSWD